MAIRGTVQGVGFRPFIYRLANELELTGWICNSAQGVLIEAEGPPENLANFLERTQNEKPPRAVIHDLTETTLDPLGSSVFDIRESEAEGETTIAILPDVATCPDCLAEIFDPNNRRYRYPFTNCTNCGPRFSVVESLPYDRPNTSMRIFTMCDPCRTEYTAPLDRRFHAQPNACPQCGPHLTLCDNHGQTTAHGDDALQMTARAVREGRIAAIKGLGGFHLVVDGRNDEAIRLLRARKGRDEKPFALMARDLHMARQYCDVSPSEARILTSPEAPIVLLRRRSDALSDAVAPDNPFLGMMLPYTPLHHLFMAEIDAPIVATSGNLSEEPICIDNAEAIERLGSIADLFLTHDRPIVRPIDDSVISVTAGRPLLLRRARGYAPSPIVVDGGSARHTLAVGAHLKNTAAISMGDQYFVSQHVGDLSSAVSFRSFKRIIESLEGLYRFRPEKIACDMHPDYLSTKYAESLGIALVKVQHHYAHVLSCMADNGIDAPVLGVCWDGTGFGTDATVWGGEFLYVDDRSFSRRAHLRTFRLPGGERAVREPRRSATGLLYEIYGHELFDNDTLAPVAAFTKSDRDILAKMLEDGINAPMTSSAGRLFDAVASLVGLHQSSNFEGQAAMALEFAAHRYNGDRPLPPYPFGRIEDENHASIVDWQPTVCAIIDDLRTGSPVDEIAARFHETMVEIIIGVSEAVGEPKVILTGGCFQNRFLTERTITRLRQAEFQPYWHDRVPPNDGGISLGQIVAANRSNDGGS